MCDGPSPIRSSLTSTTRSALNVPTEDRVALHNIQCATVDAWARQVVAVVREMSLDEARFAVHAGFALVVDLGRFVHYAPSESALAVVRHLVLTTLLGDGEQPRRKHAAGAAIQR